MRISEVELLRTFSLGDLCYPHVMKELRGLLCVLLAWVQLCTGGLTSSYVPRTGVLSKVAGTILKPADLILDPEGRAYGEHNIFQGTYREVIKEPVLTVADKVEKQFKAISPGTQWCGAGDRAESSGQLGVFKYTDDCCRYHDNCPDNIVASESKYGLNNTGSFTRSHCDCDDEFYECLKKANSAISFKIGNLYFNVLGPKCFKLEHPIIGCDHESGLIVRRCERYKFDTSREKEWQWFDAKIY